MPRQSETMFFSSATFMLWMRTLSLAFRSPRRPIPSSRTTITLNDGRSAASPDQLSRTSLTISSSISSGRDGRSPFSFFCVIAVICDHVKSDLPSSFFIRSEYGARSVISSHITIANEKTSADVS